MTRKTASFGSALLVAAVLLLAAGAQSADTFAVTILSQNNTTITLGWTPQTGYGYLFSANGVLVSRTNDPSRNSVKFAKNTANSYDIDVIVKGANGHCCTVTPPPPPKNQCEDGVDNDGDGKIDYPADPGCTGLTDNDETDPVQPPPSTITGTQCNQRAAVAGTLISNVTVTDDCDITAQNVTIQNSTVQGTVKFTPSSSGSKLLNSTAMGFYIFGADNIRLEGNTLDAQGHDNLNIMWDEPAGNRPDNFVIRNNTIKNVYDDADPSSHNEGLYVGYSAGGLIEGNTFTNNGNTGHLFFTNFGNQFNGTSYPRNICVRGNTFGPTHGAYYDIQIHGNVTSVGPTTTQIRIDPKQQLPHGIADGTSNPSQWLASC